MLQTYLSVRYYQNCLIDGKNKFGWQHGEVDDVIDWHRARLQVL